MNYERLFNALGFLEEGKSGNESYGDCIFCGKRRKMYANMQSGLWSCKSASCGKTGSIPEVISYYHEHILRLTSQSYISELSSIKGIAVSILNEAQIAYDSRRSRWIIPIRSLSGNTLSLKLFQPSKNSKLEGLPCMDCSLYGLETLSQDSNLSEYPVYICEGEWDALALRQLLNRQPENIIATPGAAVWRSEWSQYFRNRCVVLCFDNDADGSSATLKVAHSLHSFARSVSAIEWPKSIPDKFDIRDFLIHGGTDKVFRNLIVSASDSIGSPEGNRKMPRSYPPLTSPNFPELEKVTDNPISTQSGRRSPSFQDTLEVYKSHLCMTGDMVDALSVIYATILMSQVGGDPLWLHIVSPPGGGKTELLTSCAQCPLTVFRSKITAPSLISGWRTKDGHDPSLIPLLFGKSFILKDFTEILQMQQGQKDEIYSLLRGAYDGYVQKQFGNDILREYRGYFNMITGVTPAIFSEHRSVLGERFLYFQMKLPDPGVVQDVIDRAIENTGSESPIREHLSAAANAFLNIPRSGPDPISPYYKRKLASLSQLVSMLRATVDKDYVRDYIPYRPSPEYATRLVKQLVKMGLGLSLLNPNGGFGPNEYRILCKIAMDSSIGWNVDALNALFEDDGQTAKEIAQSANIPLPTLREHLEELQMLSVIHREVPVDSENQSRYWISMNARKHHKIALGNGHLPLKSSRSIHPIDPSINRRSKGD